MIKSELARKLVARPHDGCRQNHQQNHRQNVCWAHSTIINFSIKIVNIEKIDFTMGMRRRTWSTSPPSPKAVALAHRFSESGSLKAEEFSCGGGVVIALIQSLPRQIDLYIKEKRLEVDAGLGQAGRESGLLLPGVGVGYFGSEVLGGDFT